MASARARLESRRPASGRHVAGTEPPRPQEGDDGQNPRGEQNQQISESSTPAAWSQAGTGFRRSSLSCNLGAEAPRSRRKSEQENSSISAWYKRLALRRLLTEALRLQPSIRVPLYNRRSACAADNPLQRPRRTTERQRRQRSETVHGEPTQARTLVAPLSRRTLQRNRRNIAGWIVVRGIPVRSSFARYAETCSRGSITQRSRIVSRWPRSKAQR